MPFRLTFLEGVGPTDLAEKTSFAEGFTGYTVAAKDVWPGAPWLFVKQTMIGFGLATISIRAVWMVS